MTFSVQLVHEAEKDILDIYQYILSNDTVEKAVYFLNHIESCLESLSKLPQRGSYPPELERLNIKDYREIFYKRYPIIYRILDKRVIIHSILDGRRDFSTLLEQRLLRR